VYHFKKHRIPLEAVAAAWLIVVSAGAAIAVEQRPPEEIRVGIANLQRLVDAYWRTPLVRATLQRRKVSEEYRQKQIELARLEQELVDQRFWFFARKKQDERINQLRDELDAVAAAEAGKKRAREREAIDELLVDVQKAARNTAAGQNLSIVFDADNPHILFLNQMGSADITDELIEALNSDQMPKYND
jgi:Skp family chaperone for outer membrane proteins